MTLLGEERAEAMRLYRDPNWTDRDIARKFGVTRNAVIGIANREHVRAARKARRRRRPAGKPRFRARHPEAIINEALTRYQAGESPKSICGDLNILNSTLQRWRRSRGIPPQIRRAPQRRISVQEWDRTVVPMWREYVRQEEIAAELGLSVQAFQLQSSKRDLCQKHPRCQSLMLRLTAIRKRSPALAETIRVIAAEAGAQAAHAEIDTIYDAERRAKAEARNAGREAAEWAAERAERDGALSALPRNAQMFWLYDHAGLTLQAIGDRYGVTRERVRQIINHERRVS